MLDRLALLWKTLPLLPRLVAHRPESGVTVADWIENRAIEHRDRPLLLFEERTVSYGDVNAAANRVAHWAGTQGLRPGDVVALLMENRPEYISTWAGLAKRGVVTALLNTNLSGRPLEHAIETARAKALIVGSELLPRISERAGTAEGLPVWVARDPAAPGMDFPPEAADLNAALGLCFDDDPDPAARRELRARHDLFYIYTSGTTGLPKAARMSHLRFLALGEATAWALGLTPGDVHYCTLPLYHTAGGAMIVASVLAAGATIALRRKFSASQFWSDVRRYDATCFQYIGELCRYLMAQPPHPDERRHRVRVAIGNGLRADIWEPFQKRFGIGRIVEFYGATEGNVAIMNLENKVGSVGRFPFQWLTNAKLVRFDVETERHVRDERGLCVECAPGEIGELVGRIPPGKNAALGRFEGYTSNEETERKILRDAFQRGDAWFRTGDLLRQDAEGFFYFVDRIGDTFRWKGENVSTQEVAEILSTFPGLETVNVYGVSVKGYDGRAGMAALSLANPHAFDGQGFYRFVKDALPPYAAPVFVRIVGEAEMTGTFKLRKVTLQEQGFDPERAAPVFVRDDEAGAYVPLTAEIVGAIDRGERRL